jgi:hypothetical protein
MQFCLNFSKMAKKVWVTLLFLVKILIFNEKSFRFCRVGSQNILKNILGALRHPSNAHHLKEQIQSFHLMYDT